jgi:hypothetical protein
MLDRAPNHIALRERERPDQLGPIPELTGWSLDKDDFQAIDKILAETIKDPCGPEFMAPPEHRPEV